VIGEIPAANGESTHSSARLVRAASLKTQVCQLLIGEWIEPIRRPGNLPLEAARHAIRECPANRDEFCHRPAATHNDDFLSGTNHFHQLRQVILSTAVGYISRSINYIPVVRVARTTLVRGLKVLELENAKSVRFAKILSSPLNRHFRRNSLIP
jgi:hypothetical protein